MYANWRWHYTIRILNQIAFYGFLSRINRCNSIHYPIFSDILAEITKCFSVISITFRSVTEKKQVRTRSAWTQLNIFCQESRSPYYKHTLSAQRRLIETDKTEHFTTALEAESQGYRHFFSTERFATALAEEPHGCKHILDTIVR